MKDSFVLGRGARRYIPAHTMGEVLTLELEQKAAAVRELLAAAVQQHGKVVYSNSLGAEAMVLTDIIWSHVPEIDIFSIDTGRLHEETYELLEKLERRYKKRIKLVYPGLREPREARRQAGRERLLPQPRCPPRLLPRAQGRAVQACHRRLRRLGHGRAPRSSPRRARSGEPIEWDAPNGLLQGQPAARLDRRAGLAIHPRPQDSLQHTARSPVPEHRLLALHPRHPARRGSARRAAGGGSSRNRASAACNRGYVTPSARA